LWQGRETHEPRLSSHIQLVKRTASHTITVEALRPLRGEKLSRTPKAPRSEMSMERSCTMYCKSLLLLLVCFVAATMLVAGCGDDTTKDPTNTKPTTQPAPKPKPEPKPEPKR